MFGLTILVGATIAVLSIPTILLTVVAFKALNSKQKGDD